MNDNKSIKKVQLVDVVDMDTGEVSIQIDADSLGGERYSYSSKTNIPPHIIDMGKEAIQNYFDKICIRCLSPIPFSGYNKRIEENMGLCKKCISKQPYTTRIKKKWHHNHKKQLKKNQRQYDKQRLQGLVKGNVLLEDTSSRRLLKDIILLRKQIELLEQK